MHATTVCVLLLGAAMAVLSLNPERHCETRACPTFVTDVTCPSAGFCLSTAAMVTRIDPMSVYMSADLDKWEPVEQPDNIPFLLYVGADPLGPAIATGMSFNHDVPAVILSAGRGKPFVNVPGFDSWAIEAQVVANGAKTADDVVFGVVTRVDTATANPYQSIVTVPANGEPITHPPLPTELRPFGEIESASFPSPKVWYASMAREYSTNVARFRGESDTRAGCLRVTASLCVPAPALTVAQLREENLRSLRQLQFAGAAAEDAPTGAVIKTLDGGQTWAPVLNETDGTMFTGISCSSVDRCITGFKTRSTSGLRRTTDGGLSWQTVWSETIPGLEIVRVKAAKEGDAAFAIGHIYTKITDDETKRQGVILFSSDGGAKWDSIVDDDTDQFNGVDVRDDSSFFVAAGTIDGNGKENRPILSVYVSAGNV